MLSMAGSYADKPLKVAQGSPGHSTGFQPITQYLSNNGFGGGEKANLGISI